MEEKNLALGLSILGVYAIGLLSLLLATVATPFLFIYSLFVPAGPREVIESIFDEEIDVGDFL